jgi:ribose transport system ATP-binding protein
MLDTQAMENPAPAQTVSSALAITDLSKSFGGAKALNGISLEVAHGEIHGLLGQNGSGKSTLVKILAGVHAPDAGILTLNGRPVSLPLRPGAFRHLGLSFVHQNLGLIPSLTVLENLRIGPLTANERPFINWSRERDLAAGAFERFGIEIDPAVRLSTLNQTNRALVAIVRAFEDISAARTATGQPGLLLLDEPTPFLPREGVEKLFALMRQIVAQGTSVIFISHDIDEIMDITDRATILRDGNVVGNLVTKDSSRDDFVESILGRRIQRNNTDEKPLRSHDQPVLAFFDKISGDGLKSCSFQIHAGEIVGMTGLIGSGYERVPYLTFGAAKAVSGALTLDGKRYDLPSMRPKSAIHAGIALLPADRQNESGVGALPIADNILLLDLRRFLRHGLLDRAAMRRSAREISGEFEVRPNNPSLPLSALSGGNAQKVLLAKWMKQNPKLLMLDEPTQGVDIGARRQIFSAIRAAAADGASVLCASSDFEQLAEICDRVLIFARGVIVDELVGDEISKDSIAERCYGSVSLKNG